MLERSPRSRTPSQRELEASQASSLQTPPRTRGAGRAQSLSIRKQAAAGSRRRASAGISKTPTPAPASAQPPRPTPSPSPPPSPESSRRSIEESLAPAPPAAAAAVEEVSEGEELAAVDLDVRIKISVDSKPSVTFNKRLSELRLFDVVNKHRHHLKRQLNIQVPPLAGPYVSQLALRSVNKHIHSIYNNRGDFMDNSALWQEFLSEFQWHALALQKVRRAGGREVVLNIEVPLKAEKRRRRSLASNSPTETSLASDSEDGLDVTQTRRKRKSTKRKRKGRETSTQKIRRENQHNQETEALLNNYMRAIRTAHRYMAQTYKNHNKFMCVMVNIPSTFKELVASHITLKDYQLKR